MPELNTKLIEACQRYINDPTEERKKKLYNMLQADYLDKLCSAVIDKLIEEGIIDG